MEPAREALALWRGDALADVAGEPFAAAEIRRLEELWLRAKESAIDADLAAGRHAQVLPELEALVAAHPLQERLHAQRMLALYRSGRQADALAAYRAAREVLVEQIGVEPGPELRRLHEAMLEQDPKLDQPAVAPTPTVRPSRGPPRRVLAVVGALLVVCGAGGLRCHPAHGIGRARADRRERGRRDRARLRADHDAVHRRPRPERHRRRRRLGMGRESAGRHRYPARWRARLRSSSRSVTARPRWRSRRDRCGSSMPRSAVSRESTRRPTASRTRIPAGNAPSGVAAGFGALWVTSEVDRTLARIDLRTAARTEIDLGANPTAVATGADAVWVTSEEGGVVFRIEPRLREVTDTIGVGNGPVAVAVGEGAVWVVNRQDATVSPHRPGDEPGHGRRAGRPRPERDRGRRRRGVGDERQRGRGHTNRSRRRGGARRRSRSRAARARSRSPTARCGRRQLAAPAGHRGGTLRVESPSVRSPSASKRTPTPGSYA